MLPDTRYLNGDFTVKFANEKYKNYYISMC